MSSVDMEILSLALGHEASELFKCILKCTSSSEKLNSIAVDGIILKEAVKSRLKVTNSEVSNTANKAVVDVIVGQYQIKIDELARQRSLLSDVEKERIKQKELLKASIDRHEPVKNQIDGHDLLKDKPQKIENKTMSVESRVNGTNSVMPNPVNKAVVDENYLDSIDEVAQTKSPISDVERARQKKLLEECIERQALFKKKVEEQRLLKDEQQRLEYKRIAEKQKQERIDHKKHHIDFPDFDTFDVKKKSKVAKLLNQLRQKVISEDELRWLEEVGFANEAIQKKNHLHIAQLHLTNWLDKKKPWELVNASAAYRKLDMPNRIKPILAESYPFKFTNNNDNLKSALLTTYGGVCRDLGSYKHSLKLGHEAHQVTPLNFRPCTLLGAVYISTGEFNIGHEWYEKARERGFSQSAYDNDIHSIYLRANQEMKKRLKENLIQTGHKYNWL
ncbi:MAG: hypothetical protein WBM99_12915 [Psychromonas sp.]